ncbi:MAG: alpha/beta hydrolase [Actinobacteria bacterium]|nr:alpha/beta hydrolase [Actinomycetota bacterium]
MTAAIRRLPARVRTVAVALAALLLVSTIGLPGDARAADRTPSAPKPTIVLVHGAFADASGWHAVIERLARKGYNVIAPANPLHGLASDVQYVRDFLATIDGPIVLVGHSYGGFVITNAATGDADVKALVYIAAFAPDEGETVGGISASAPGSLLGPDTLTVRPYTGADGTQHLEGYITPTRYREVFAADVDRTDAWVYAVSQKPADLSILQTPSGTPAWKTIPSWTLVATRDRVIPPDAQRAMAERAGATTIEVTASHSVADSRSWKVAAFIERAASSVR